MSHLSTLGVCGPSQVSSTVWTHGPHSGFLQEADGKIQPSMWSQHTVVSTAKLPVAGKASPPLDSPKAARRAAAVLKQIVKQQHSPSTLFQHVCNLQIVAQGNPSLGLAVH